MKILEDVVNITIKYYNINRVFSTSYCPYGGHGHLSDLATTWTEVKQLNRKNMNMTKVRAGKHHGQFSDSEGGVWVCGKNQRGQLGLGHAKTSIKTIRCIDFFVKHNIRIKEIECGFEHVIMMDCNNSLQLFGNNYYGQIGDGLREDVKKPRKMIMFRGISEEIKTDGYHVYANIIFGDFINLVNAWSIQK